MTDDGASEGPEPTDDPFEPYGPMIALGFSVTAMNAAADRVNMIAAGDLEGAFAAIGETVWWVTVVSDTLSAGHAAAYSRVVELQTPRASRTSSPASICAPPNRA